MSKIIRFDEPSTPAADEIYIDELPGDLVNSQAIEFITLSWHQRCRPRRRCATDEGTNVILALPRGSILTDDMLLYCSAELSIRVKAQLEDVLVIRPANGTEACMVAHHLGNWHRSIELESNGAIVVEPDQPLLEWLSKAKIEFKAVRRTFHPNLKGTVHENLSTL